jgi:hypothetical protein
VRPRLGNQDEECDDLLEEEADDNSIPGNIVPGVRGKIEAELEYSKTKHGYRTVSVRAALRARLQNHEGPVPNRNEQLLAGGS